MPRHKSRDDLRFILELLSLGPLVEQLSRTTTGTARFYATSKVQLQALLIPAAVGLALAAYAAGAVTLALRRARRAGGSAPGVVAERPRPPGLPIAARPTGPEVR